MKFSFIRSLFTRLLKSMMEKSLRAALLVRPRNKRTTAILAVTLAICAVVLYRVDSLPAWLMAIFTAVFSVTLTVFLKSCKGDYDPDAS
ncbi:hypothetical protein QU487_06230 [Crenobacter sp. SG2305]|uniref:hypothetical protein n=1 Tax=Crenobacter oryzisoli TaxID=3056844 RepID=UPI0025AB3D83|nr:hypothetical protein [Crenobacter sp. SG2305]MDN0082349.1 hypothetical protein [Crenobacter sp. SG2305]